MVRRRAATQENPTKPGTPPVVTHGALGNAVQPAAQVASVEPAQLAANDQKYFLGQVFDIGGHAAQSANPARDVVERRRVNLLEGQRRALMLLEHDIEWR